MWLDKQNPEVVFYLGSAVAGLVGILTFTTLSRNSDRLVKGLLVWLVVVAIVYYILDWLVKNNHAEVAWLVACLPLVGVVIHAHQVYKVCGKSAVTALTSTSF
jgi:type II secretory pathway component PulF